MTDIDGRLRSVADLAEYAATDRQLAGLDGPRSTGTVIAGLQLTADMLRYAAEVLSQPPVASRRLLHVSLAMGGTNVVSWVAALLIVPDPGDPLVLAAVLVGSSVLAKLAGDLFDEILDRRLDRTRRTPRGTRLEIAELRTMILAIGRALETDRDDRHLEVGSRIDSAMVWLDHAERAQARLEAELPRS
ncbi:hypothetical protein DFJ67_4896 [Asanoa ferruginea]|uniref:Uncharacterized protein n=1 Tax=Asanoa ferruginea TaxID=53367 RepID=A0A3D9ZNP3_9ACTN|nr:hypothetical protein [Asanoa ferruginea]REF98871.1 hypothetical protein DFJ67_4896 [Asanoa ferruginea]GIF46447.1 hypothetical protein Afe04nite_09860 [Asanoa ferruginea]